MTGWILFLFIGAQQYPATAVFKDYGSCLNAANSIRDPAEGLSEVKVLCIPQYQRR
jgi:hypothetical protein